MQVHQLRKEGLGVAAIARECGITRNTVYSYLGKDLEEAFEWGSTLKTRRRKLDPYRDYNFWGTLSGLFLAEQRKTLKS